MSIRTPLIVVGAVVLAFSAVVVVAGVVLAAMFGVVLPAGTAAAAPYCGITWGSLPKSANPTAYGELVNRA